MQILTFQHQTIIEIDQFAGIHRVTVFKQPGSNYLLARVGLMDALLHYQYPFRFPGLFERNRTNYKRLIRIEFIKTFSSKDPHKSFNLRQFFNTYRVSNQKIKKVKQIFIYLIKIFQQYQLIEDEALLLTNGSMINIHNLTASNISDDIILYENFNTHSLYYKRSLIWVIRVNSSFYSYFSLTNLFLTIRCYFFIQIKFNSLYFTI
jgi:hypothetical protein